MNKMLYPNCSESTFRLKANNLSQERIDELIKDIKKLILEKQNDKGYEINEIEEVFDMENYETSVFTDNIFDTKVITVKGDFPFNNSGELEDFANEKDLQYEFEEE